MRLLSRSFRVVRTITREIVRAARPLLTGNACCHGCGRPLSFVEHLAPHGGSPPRRVVCDVCHGMATQDIVDLGVTVERYAHEVAQRPFRL